MPTPPLESPATQTTPLDALPRRGFTLRRMGRYELIDEVGRGGMGVVYRAWDPELGREVAVKILATGPHAADASRLRFLREARAAARLEHPGIVRVYDIGEHEGSAYFTMPLIVGPTLSARLREGPIPPETAATWTAQVARALHHAHSQGLVHRDVKPGNILLEGGERPLLTDFGLVRQLDLDEAALTRESQLLGTPAYMSPEQAQGDPEGMGPLSDQYSLGVVLYEQLTGERPFKDGHPAVLLRRILDEDVPPITRPGVPRALAAIAERAARRDPAERYTDCEAMAVDLDRFLRGEVVQAGTTTAALRLRAALRRHRRPLGSATRGMLAVGGLLGLLAMGARWRDLQDAQDREAAAESRRVALEQRLTELYDAGNPDEAEAQFAAFAAFEGNRDTQALGQAWRGLGALRAEHNDAEGALDAYANAWLLADDNARQVGVLTDMAGLLRARHAWSALGAVAETLRGLGAPPSATAKGWRRDLAVVRGDMPAALSLTDDPAERAILQRLALATETSHEGEEIAPIDLDGDGRAELALRQLDQPELTLLDTSSPELPTRRVVPDVFERGYQGVSAFPSVPGRAPLLLVGWSSTRVLRWERDHLVEIAHLKGRLRDVTAADMDGDGVVEYYLPNSDDLYRVDLRDDTFRIGPASAEHSASRSSSNTITQSDLDQDGQPELVLGTTTWTGYDVRVLKQGSNGLGIATRRRLGSTGTVAALRTAAGPAVVAWHDTDPREITNRQMFRPDELEGEERGLYVLAMGPGGLESRAQRPMSELPTLPSVVARPEPLYDQTTVLVGDLDGDALDEIVFGDGHGWTLVLVQHADGRLSELNFPGYFPLALANVDADPEQEIVAMRTGPSHRIWVLGAGDQPLPLEAVAPPEVRPRPSGLSPDLAQAWDRAEALVAIGRTRTAAQRLEALADMAQDDRVAAAGLQRAAALYAVLDAHDHASELLLRAAARQPDAAAAALESAQAEALDDLDVRRALTAAEARLALPSPPTGLAAQVERLRDTLARPEHVYDLRQGLDPAWHVRSAVGVVQRPGLGLELLSAERAPLLDLPVRWDGGPIRLEIELELRRLDWAGMLSFGLISPTTGPLADQIIIASGGGAGVLEQGVRCLGVRGRFDMPLRRGALTDRTLRVSYELDTEHHRASCALEGAGALDARYVDALLASDLPPGRLTLRLGGNPAYDAQANVLVQAIRMWGLEPLSEPATPTEQVNRLLAADRPAEALELLAGQRGARAELARALAYAALGRRAESSAAMRLALATDPELDGELGRVMRGALDRFEPELRAHFGESFPLRLWAHSEEIIEMHPNDPPAQELLTRSFAGVEDVNPAHLADDDARLELTQILLRRAAAWRRDGRSTAALQDLAQAESIATGVLNHAHAARDQMTASRQISAVRRERALLYLSRGEADQAMAELLRGLAASPAPTVFADVVVATPEFDPLHSRPEWPTIEAGRRLWTEAPTTAGP